MANRTAILSVRILGDGSAARRELDRTARAVAGFATATIKLAALTSAIGFAVGAVGNLGVGLVGLGLLAAPALAAVKVGMEGIKQAAQTAAPALARLREAVSATFAREMAPAFAQLSGLLDRITPAMTGIASAVSGVFRAVVAQLTGPGAAAIDRILSGAKTFVASLTPGLTKLTQGLLDLGASAASVAGRIGTAFGGVLGAIGAAFSRLAADGTLTRLFAGFAQALSGLGALIGPVVVLFARLGAVVGPALGSAFASIGRVITSVTPYLEKMAATVGGALTGALNALISTGALPQIARALSAVTAAVAPLVPPLARLAGILAAGLAQLVSALAPSFAAVVKSLAGGLVSILPTVADLFARLVPVVAQIAAEIAGSLMQAIKMLVDSGVLTLIARAFTDLLRAVAPLLPHLVRLAGILAAGLLQAVSSLAPLFVALAKSLAGGLASILPTIANLFARLVPVVQQVATEIAGSLVAAIKMLVDSGVLPVLVGAFSDLIVAVVPLVPPLVRLAASILPLLAKAMIAATPVVVTVVKALTSLANIIVSQANPLIEKFTAGVARVPEVLSKMAGPARSAFEAIRSAITAVVNAVRSLLSVLGSLRWPSPPSWLKKFFGGRAAELTAIPTGADVVRFLPTGFDAFAAPGPELRAAAPTLAGWVGAVAAAPPPQVTNIHITINGAVDPQSTAQQIQRVLRARNITVGASAAINLKVA
ncbi:hypothetical protein [Nocardia altamirensis]|uniref:hypothetical protein n=1 Tax=Nocardia altamirensis TaxID=472158 RepID=UPI0008400DBF|nr:hypothetical protein [Nocardia altamirensis]